MTRPWRPGDPCAELCDSRREAARRLSPESPGEVQAACWDVDERRAQAALRRSDRDYKQLINDMEEQLDVDIEPPALDTWDESTRTTR